MTEAIQSALLVLAARRDDTLLARLVVQPAQVAEQRQVPLRVTHASSRVLQEQQRKSSPWY